MARFANELASLQILATDEAIVAGIDASEMDESFYEPQWESEKGWHPFVGMAAAEKGDDLERHSSGSGYTPESEKDVHASSAVRPVASP